jgi:uncharacterized protein YgbK (DUF1537 family)
MIAPVERAALFSSLPPEWPHDPLPDIQALRRASGEKVVALDDDPTGTQTVYDLPVLTHWDVEALAAELAQDWPALYILTNSRSLPLAQAQALNQEIGAALQAAARQVGCRLAVISRSDSTLRGHYPGEVEALMNALGGGFDATLLIPAFFDGGRYTIHDIHYVAEGDMLIPAGQTPFAQDSAFGYQSSNLRDWVQEKTQGRIRAADVAAISLETIRQGGPQQIADQIKALPQGSVCIVNAASPRDIDTATLGSMLAEQAGRRFLYRTAANFVAARSGLPPRPLLTPAQMAPHTTSTGGLVVVGSHVPRSSRQLDALLQQTDITGIEVPVEQLLDDEQAPAVIHRVMMETAAHLALGWDVVVYTSRSVITGAGGEASLPISQRVSQSLVAIVRGLHVRPRFLIAKGGITASDLATSALSMRRALVLGQLLPGVPVWQPGPESRYPDMPYVVFPGNVGDDKSLLHAVRAMGENEGAV